jgi:hypothetical protein
VRELAEADHQQSLMPLAWRPRRSHRPHLTTGEPIVDEILAIPVDADPRRDSIRPTRNLARRSTDADCVDTRPPWVFTSDDAGFEPILVRPYLPPKARLVHVELLGVLEVLIDTNGAVETVHLRSPGNRYRERWWVLPPSNGSFNRH